MNPLVNIYTPGECIVWLVLVEYGEDYTPEEFEDVEEIGTPPKWLSRELEENDGWKTFLMPEHRAEKTGLGWVFGTTWTEWALREGIAPGQPFSVATQRPYYSRDYYGECDVEFYCDLHSIAPWPTERVLAAWEQHQKDLAEYRTKAIKAMQELTDKRKHDVSAMYLHFSPYFSSKGSSWDDMAMPDGIAVSLCSSHTQVEGYPKMTYGALAQGRDDDGDHQKALESLLANVAESLPHLTEGMIRKLHRRY